ncbi:MAG: M55 family metallopeptidase [Armatimonadetes bacterium]|nr:M55 family metallopeptidase [Armatimonadota bacterium]
MRIYLMTDMEGVAGVVNFEDWCEPGGAYYDIGKELLTGEVNAAVDGFFAGGATEVLVADGHGAGGIHPHLLDSRAEYMRGWPGDWPLGLEDRPFDGLASVGQHAKACTPRAHLAHTQGLNYIDLSVNGVSIGEFGQIALCAGHLGIPSFFGSGDLAFTREAEALTPGIVAVAVKRGTRAGTGEGLTEKAYGLYHSAAIHLSPERARQSIRDGAQKAAEKLRQAPPAPVKLMPPYEMVAVFRGEKEGERITARASHPSDFIALMNAPFIYDPKE